MPDIAMVAALEREVWPLIRGWRTSDREYSGGQYRFFEKANCVLVCGGIGSEAARRATEAVIALYTPSAVWSVGFAGALEDRLHVGELLELRYVVDARDGSKVDTGSGDGVLVSFLSVVGEEQKAKLARAYGAKAVDMEAASVARGAQCHGVAFAAVKVISDEMGFPMPPMDRFSGEDGQFRTASFIMYAALRPWLWATVVRLGRNTSRASHVLCERLQNSLREASEPNTSIPQAALKDS